MRSIGKAVLAVSVGSLLFLNASCGVTHGVTVNDTGYDPHRVKTYDQSDSVQWNNTGTTNHTATSQGNGAFFDTGEIPTASSSSAIAFHDAGIFPYFDKDHPSATGLVEVPLAVQSDASPGDTINVQWAGYPGSGYTIPVGFHADIQVKRPGDRQWHFWLTNQTGSQTSAGYKVKGRGIYRFRARYVKDGVVASEFSPRALCNVTK